MSRGDLEAQVLEGDRARATASSDMSSQLRLTAQAEADAWQQSADAEAEHDQVGADCARWLAVVLGAQRSGLEAANARYEGWSALTASTREIAEKAQAELQRRGQHATAVRTPGPQSMAAGWREFKDDADAVDHAIEREHQSAVYDRQPWPPQQKPEGRHEEPHTAALRHDPQLTQPGPGTASAQLDPEPYPSEPETPASEATEPGLARDGRAARLDELQARADKAAGRINAQLAELNASSQHIARVQGEALTEREAAPQAETHHDMEMEL